MTADAMLVAGDSRYAVVAKRQSLTHERRRTVSNPPRYYVSDEVSPSIKSDPEEESRPLPSKGKAYMKWMGNMVGDTVFAAWSASTFQKPREGVDYH